MSEFRVVQVKSGKYRVQERFPTGWVEHNGKGEERRKMFDWKFHDDIFSDLEEALNELDRLNDKKQEEKNNGTVIKVINGIGETK